MEHKYKERERETAREKPPYYIRGFEFRAISGLGRIGAGGGLVSDFEHYHHVVHLGLGRASWQGTQGLPPAISTASLPVLARRFRGDPHEVGRIEGLGLDSLELAEHVDQGQRPPAGCSRRQSPIR